MEKTNLVIPTSPPCPFVGREKEAAQLEGLHAQRKHLLILGPAGAGKTALVNHLKDRLGLVVCPRSDCFGEICEGLEGQLGLSGEGRKLLQRKQRVRQALAACHRTVVFDGVGWTTPKVASFIESVSQRVPVWICARSEHPWDIGHIWPLLTRFSRVAVKPFSLAQTRALVTAAVAAGLVAGGAVELVAWFHRRSGGIPLVLSELLAEAATGKDDLGNAHARWRLEMDRRIHQLFPMEGCHERES